MHIQQVRQVRKLVVGSDGRTYTKVTIEPETNAGNLNSDGKDYPSVGNGVFNVPDDLGATLVGGLFRDVSNVKGADLAKGFAPDHLSQLARERRAEGPMAAVEPVETAPAPQTTPTPDPEPEKAPEKAAAPKPTKKARGTTKKAPRRT